jgi:hypothetical protein
MQVWISVNEADIGNIHPGQPVSFTVDAFPNRTFQGKVGKVRLNATMTQNVVTYTVEVNTDNSDGHVIALFDSQRPIPDRRAPPMSFGPKRGLALAAAERFDRPRFSRFRWRLQQRLHMNRRKKWNQPTPAIRRRYGWRRGICPAHSGHSSD